MRWALLLLACGCNPLYGIERTELWDAPAPPDAPPPPSCPAPGVTPTFGADLTMVAARDCESYGLDTAGTTAAALRRDPTTNYPGPVVGPANEQPTAVTLQPPLMYVYTVRLAPEGDTMFLVTYESGAYVTRVYQLGETGWVEAGTRFAPADATAYFDLSTPTRGPIRRLVADVYSYDTSSRRLVELEYDGTTAKELWSTPVDELEVTAVREPSLSADGLRLVFTSYVTAPTTGGGGGSSDGGGGGGVIVTTADYDQPVFYMSRPSLDAPFRGKAQVLDTVPDQVSWPHLTEDCGRIYFGALDTVWYLKLAQ